MHRRHRHKKPARSAAHRDPKPTILIVTEGSITEPQYIRGFVNACHNPRVRIEVHGGVGVPKTIVRYARDMKKAADRQADGERDENLRYDEVWCVFDVDQHPNLSDAKVTARDNGIELAISNPCIEIWLWLHFAEQPGSWQRHDIQNMLRKHIPNYSKHVDYRDYEAGYKDAVRRARMLDDVAEQVKDHGRNPSTGVWRLTESIQSNS